MWAVVRNGKWAQSVICRRRTKAEALRDIEEIKQAPPGMYSLPHTMYYVVNENAQ